MKRKIVSSQMDFGTLILASLMFAIMVIGTIYALCIGHPNTILFGMFAAGAFGLARYAWLEGTKEVEEKKS